MRGIKPLSQESTPREASPLWARAVIRDVCMSVHPAHDGSAQTANQAQSQREQPPSPFAPTVTASAVGGALSLPTPGDADLGEQQMLSSTYDEYPPFTSRRAWRSLTGTSESGADLKWRAERFCLGASCCSSILTQSADN